MTSRTLLGAASALAASLCLTPAAFAAPLSGKGENIQPIAHIDVDDAQVNEIELAGDYAYVNHDQGLDIIDISDPSNPKTVGEWKCTGGWGDLDLSKDASFAVMPKAHSGNPCPGTGTAAVILDIRDKRKPKVWSKIDLDPDQTGFGQYVHTTTLDNNTLYLNPQIAAFYPQEQQRIAVWDVSDPGAPKRKGNVNFATGEMAVGHDTYIDHRPDGKNLMYAASIHESHVVDVTDPTNARVLQRVPMKDGTISHQTQPNWDRKTIILSDESLIDQNGESEGNCGKAGPANVGTTLFYPAAADGTYANGGLQPQGSFGLPPGKYDRTCTSHVFVTALNQNRLTQAWYAEGGKVIDFTDPAAAKQLGWFQPTDGDENVGTYWSFKPHRGYLFASDMARGMDIVRYTGPGWPANSGPAEELRARDQGVPYVPLTADTKKPGPLPAPKPAPGTRGAGSGGSTGGGSGSASNRSIGKFSFIARINRRKLSRWVGKRATLTVTFTNAKGKRVGAVRFKKRRDKTRKYWVRVTGVAEAGTYRWSVRRGKRLLKSGRVTVKPTAGLSLSPNAVLTARAR